MNDIVWHNVTVTRQDREKQNKHKSVVIWFTGLSGSGKSTIAHALEGHLHRLGCRTFVFDGDNVRHGLCSDLGFTLKDRKENIRRIGEMAKLFIESGIIALTAFISPVEEDRRNVRKLFSENDFIEVYCNSSIKICEQRDVKGIYKRARSGEILNFTGISSPYEPPVNPELIINTEEDSIDKCIDVILKKLIALNVIDRKNV